MTSTPGPDPAKSAPLLLSRCALLLLTVWAGVLVLRAPAAHAASGAWTGGGPRAKSVRAIVRDPLNPLRMWAATFGAGVYRSLDGGTTWTGYRTGLINTFVRCLAVNPVISDSLWCGTNDGVFISVDGGATWTKQLSTTVSVRSITIHPWSRAILYASTYGSGIYKSLNAGKNWSTINLGLVNTDVRDVALDPAFPDTLLAGTGTGGGIHRSLNGGLTWTQLSDTTASLGAIEKIAFDPTTPQRVYAATIDRGVLVSFDAGVTWVRMNTGLASLRGRSFALADTILYFGTDSAGVFVTTRNDTAWHAASTGLHLGRSVDGLLSLHGAPNTAWAGTDGFGILRTDNRGGSWSQIDGGLLTTFGFSLAVRPGTHKVYDGSGFGDQFWWSTDQGATWTRCDTLFSHDSERAVVPDPVAASTIYLAAYGLGVYRSDDDGRNWRNTDSLGTTLRNRFVRPMVAWPGQSGHLYVGTGGGVYETVDGGASWIPDTLGMPPAFSVRSLALVPGAPATLYAGSDSFGVWSSTDGGANWLQKNAGIPVSFIHGLVVDAASALTVYAATDSGVYKSTDGAGTWARARAGLPYPASVRCVTQDPTHPSALFCGVDHYGVYETLTGGASWFPLVSSIGVPDSIVHALAVDPALATLYAGTDSGVYSFGDYPRAVTGALETPVSLRFSFAIGPTPLHGGGLRIQYTLTRRGPVSVAVYNVLGERVRRVAAETVEPAGPHLLQWDGHDDWGRQAAAGLYFVHLESAEGRRTAKAILLKR